MATILKISRAKRFRDLRCGEDALLMMMRYTGDVWGFRIRVKVEPKGPNSISKYFNHGAALGAPCKADLLLVSLLPPACGCSAQRQNPAYRTCRAAPEEPTMSANAFVKTELQRSEIEPMPPKDYLLVVDPCESCGFTTRKAGTKPWESCMLQRRYSLRRNEEHPLPTIRRVPINKVRSPFGISEVSVPYRRSNGLMVPRPRFLHR